MSTIRHLHYVTWVGKIEDGAEYYPRKRPRNIIIKRIHQFSMFMRVAGGRLGSSIWLMQLTFLLRLHLLGRLPVHKLLTVREVINVGKG
jgi:hypothetical protein